MLNKLLSKLRGAPKAEAAPERTENLAPAAYFNETRVADLEASWRKLDTVKINKVSQI